MKALWLSIILIGITLLGSACGQAVEEYVWSLPPDAEEAPAPPVAADDTLLLWEGPPLFEESPSGCHRLRVTGDGKATVGPCAGEQTEVEFLINHNQEWPEILARFAPFEAETGGERIVFNGQGSVSGPAWERAVTAWARSTHAELAGGRVGATNRTRLAWNLGPAPDQADKCRMLLVLVHGQATAGVTPCEGGNMEVIATEWVDTADWEQFDKWLQERAPLYNEAGYLDGHGSADLSQDAAELAKWAQTVFDKISQAASK